MWGIKAGIKLFLSGMTTSYAAEKYTELKETTQSYTAEDREVFNKILKTGQFQLPPADVQEEKEKPNSDIVW